MLFLVILAGVAVALALMGGASAQTGGDHSAHTGAANGAAHTGAALDSLEITGAWVRPAPLGDNSAAYFTITNHGTAGVALIGAETDAARMAEIHETVMEVAVVDGRLVQNMQMRHMHELVIPAGASVSLRPGGLHVMLMGLTRDLEAGQSITLRLIAADGRHLDLVVPVSQGEPQEDEHLHEHGGHGH